MVGISNIGAEAQKVNSVKAEKDRIEKEAFSMLNYYLGEDRGYSLLR